MSAAPTIRTLQILRFVAAAMVVYVHALNMAQDAGLSARWASSAPMRNNGAAGVDVFFVISGAIIYHTALKPRMGVSEFISRRLVRIIPLYYVYTLFWISIAVFAIGLSFRPTQLLASFSLWPAWTRIDAPAIDAGWTLCFEVLFYVAAAVALLRPRLGWWLIAGYACLVIARHFTDLPAIGFLGNPLSLEFLFGIAVMRFRPKAAPWWFSLAILGAGLFALLFPTLWSGIYDYKYNLPGSTSGLRATLVGVPAALVVAGALGLEPYCRGRLATVAEFLGKASYSIYLANWVLMRVLAHLLKGSGAPAVATVAIGSVLAVTLGVLSYVTIERPLLAAIGRGRTGMPTKAMLAPAEEG